MGSLKVSIEDDLLKRFKREAMERFGYTRGSLSIAAREAIIDWLEKKRLEKGRELMNTIDKVAGVWSGEEGRKYTDKIRKEWNEREKRLDI